MKPKLEGPVIDFLTQLKFANYGKAFLDNGVDVMEDLPTITDEELQTMGVDKVGHRKKILRAIKAMEQS